jgi:hypothetical protein
MEQKKMGNSEIERFLRQFFFDLEEPLLAFVIPNMRAENMLLARVGYKLNNDGKYRVSLQQSAKNIGIKYEGESTQYKFLDMVIYRRKPVMADSIFEARMFYTFDPVYKADDTFLKSNEENLEKDINFLKSCEFDGSKYLIIFFGHYGKNEVPDHFKYNDAHNSKVEKLGSSDELMQRSKTSVTNFFLKRHLKTTFFTSLKIGSYSEVPIGLMTVLVEI